jgi:hypothetical protein
MSKIIRIFLSATIFGFAAAAAWAQTDGPVDFGRRAVAEALAARSSAIAAGTSS